MVDIVTRLNNVVNGFVWGPFGLALLSVFICTFFYLHQNCTSMGMSGTICHTFTDQREFPSASLLQAADRQSDP